MPMKSCPQCGAEHGARKLVCDCGHDFQCKRAVKRHPLYPEPGAWVLDQVRGLPELPPPDPLPLGPVSASQVKEHVAHEGLGFCVYSYIPADRISDAGLRKLWTKARAAVQEIVEYLETVDYDA